MGIRRLPFLSNPGPVLVFGPTDVCSIGIDPSGALSGLLLEEVEGVRITNPLPDGASRLRFGNNPDNLCMIVLDPAGPIEGLQVLEPKVVSIINPLPGGAARLTFGFDPQPDNKCCVFADPSGPIRGLQLLDPNGVRILSPRANGVASLGFGNDPDNNCAIVMNPAGAVRGLQLLDPNGIRIRNPLPNGVATIGFGNNPNNLCAIAMDPIGPVQGLQLRDPNGVRVLNPIPNGASRLGFGNNPDNICLIEVDPAGPAGLLLRDPRGIRILPPPSTAGVPPSNPTIRFGPTDDCSLALADLNGDGTNRLVLRDPIGVVVAAQLTVQGSVLASEFIQISTRRLKENVAPIESALEKIQQLQGVRFNWKAEQGGASDIGFIAEEVGKVFPEVVEWEADGVNAKGVNYGHLVAVAVEGIKAQQTEIKTLQEENADLQRRLELLEQLVLKGANPQAAQ
jgi:catechol 2,3-dioxygenase-like lactoylglutathione lyase family enzyme